MTSSDRRQYALELVSELVGGSELANQVLDRLDEEGLLHVGYGNRDVDVIVKTFSTLWGTTKTSKYDRFAAARMAKAEQYGGADGIASLMKLFATFQTDTYAPIVSTISQFEQKLPSIVIFLKKKQQLNEEIEL